MRSICEGTPLNGRFLTFAGLQISCKVKPGSHLWSRSRSKGRRRHKHSVDMRKVREARVKYEASNETRISKNVNILLHFVLQNWPCFTLASWFLWCERVKQCAQGSFSWNKRKTCKKQIKMAAQQEERNFEAVRKYPVLYDKADRHFKGKAKK